MVVEEPLAGVSGYGIMDPGADAAPEVPVAPLVSGVVVTDGAVLAGVAAEGGMAPGLVLVLVFSFLPQAPSASSAERATTVAVIRVFGDIKCIKILLKIIGHPMTAKNR